MSTLQNLTHILKHRLIKVVAFSATFVVTVAATTNSSFAATAGKAEHVVIVVWDGMRPDFISEQHTPAAYQLARQGTFFKNHHPVYVSSTEVNGTAINTGEYPKHSGISGNREYRPQIDKSKSVAMEDLETVRSGDSVSSGHFIAVPTLAEIVQHAGFRTAVMGTKAVTLLLDRSDKRASKAEKDSVDFFKGDVLPSSALAVLVKANDDKPFPADITFPNVEQDAWTTRALTRGLWQKDVPKFSVLWMSDPDYSQHDSAPGSPAALGAVESVDRNLAAVLKALDEKRVRDKTDIFLVSDHGFSTIERVVDVIGALTKAGFKADKKFKDPQPGNVMVVGLGGSVALYVIGHDEAIIRKLAAFFQASDFAGVIFSRVSVKGTFPLEQVRIGTTNSPDLLVSLRWNAGTNSFGTQGLLISDNNKKGAHGSLSPFDMHNTLVAAGPDFRSGFGDEFPTGNADLAPTILWILGIKPPQPMDGRILSEAMTGLNEPKAKPVQKTIEASHDGWHFHWRQYLKVSTVGDAIYFDEGDGQSVPK